MRSIADLARMCHMKYGEFYALVWGGHLPAPSHQVPMRRKKLYSEAEAVEIIDKVRQYQQAVHQDELVPETPVDDEFVQALKNAGVI
jgi:hypothetical protein